MQRVADVLASLSQKGIRISARDGKLSYSAPKGGLASRDIAVLRKFRGQILAALTQTGSAPFPSAASGSMPAPENAPTTYQQEWVWSLLKKGNSMDFLRRTYAWRLSGEVRVEVLSRSLDTVIHRHESLHTRILELDGIVKQQIDRFSASQMQILDLQGGAHSDAETNAYRILTGLLDRTAKLSDGASPLEIRLLRLTDREHILAVTMGPMFTDLTSLKLLLRELWSAYGDLLRGRQHVFAEITVQYADYAIWQRNADRHWQELHAHYWQERLRGAQPTRIPADVGAGAARSHSLAEIEVSLGKPLSSALHERAQCEHCSPAMVVLTAYTAVLAHWTDQTDFVIPFNVSGRHGAEHESMLGPLGHMLLLRIKISGRETFRELLKQVTKEFYCAYEHIDFAKVSLKNAALVNSGFLQWLSWDPTETVEAPAAEVNQSDAGLRIEPLVLPRSIATARMDFDVVLQLSNSTQGVAGYCWYRADLYTADRMQRLLRNLHQALEQLSRNCGSRITSFQP